MARPPVKKRSVLQAAHDPEVPDNVTWQGKVPQSDIDKRLAGGTPTWLTRLTDAVFKPRKGK